MNTNDQKLLHRVERNQFIDRIRHERTKQGAFDKAMWHLDHPVPGTDVYLVPSDQGAAAEKMYAALEEAPLWQKLWVKARLSLKPRQRAVLDALLVDWRSRPAAKIAGVDHKTVDDAKKIFKVHFAQCWRAYKRDFAI